MEGEERAPLASDVGVDTTVSQAQQAQQAQQAAHTAQNRLTAMPFFVYRDCGSAVHSLLGCGLFHGHANQGRPCRLDVLVHGCRWGFAFALLSLLAYGGSGLCVAFIYYCRDGACLPSERWTQEHPLLSPLALSAVILVFVGTLLTPLLAIVALMVALVCAGLALLVPLVAAAAAAAPRLTAAVPTGGAAPAAPGSV
jgi:hypothetical protein